MTEERGHASFSIILIDLFRRKKKNKWWEEKKGKDKFKDHSGGGEQGELLYRRDFTYRKGQKADGRCKGGEKARHNHPFQNTCKGLSLIRKFREHAFFHMGKDMHSVAEGKCHDKRRNNRSDVVMGNTGKRKEPHGAAHADGDIGYCQKGQSDVSEKEEDAQDNQEVGDRNERCHIFFQILAEA